MEYLPKFHPSHLQEKNSIQELGKLLPNNFFILRAEDGGDYGVDRIIEVIQDGNVTNIRSHIQVKSTGKQSRISGFIKYPVPINTLNYLINSLNSIFLVYYEKESQFYWEWAGTIALKKRKLENSSKKIGKKTFSYTFTSKLDGQALKEIHQRLVNDTELIKRMNLSSSPFEKVIVTEHIHENSYRDYLLMYTEGKFEKIIALVKENLIDSPVLNSLVSLCYYNIFNYEEALKYIIKAEQQEHDDAFQKIKVAILCEKGIKENSRETLEQAKKLFLTIESSDWGWMDLYNYGNILTGLEEYEEAGSCYNKAIQLESKEPMIWKNLSNVYKHQKIIDKEIECLDIALSLDGNLIEALICKGLSLGMNFSKFAEAIVLLEKSLGISKKTMINNSSIYYWISYFYNELKQYDKSLILIEEGLQYYPSDKNLEGIKLHTLLIASEDNPDYEYMATEILQDMRLKYPNDAVIKIELLKMLGRKKSISDLMPLINECFLLYKYELDSETIVNMDFDQIIFILQNMIVVAEFREKNNIGSLFFKEYDVSISEVQKIEMKANFLFSSLNSKMKNTTESELPVLFEKHAKNFFALNEMCAEILVADLKDGTVEEKADRITHIVTTLPEILLIELSRENGWLLQKYNHPVEVADKLISNSSLLKDWFNLCLEPILKGANNVLRFAKEDSKNNNYRDTHR